MAKGVKTGGGSRAGRPNKANAPLYEMIDQALVGVGGVEYLKQQAIDNPTAFMALIGKRLPKDVNVGGQPDNPVNVTVENSKSWLAELVSNAVTKS